MSLKSWLITKGLQGKLPDWFYRLFAKKIGKVLDLKEGPMDSDKKWYKSKGVLSGIAVVVFGTYDLVRLHVGPQVGWNLPEVPAFVYTVLGTLGIYARVTATTKVS